MLPLQNGNGETAPQRDGATDRLRDGFRARIHVSADPFDSSTTPLRSLLGRSPEQLDARGPRGPGGMVGDGEAECRREASDEVEDRIGDRGRADPAEVQGCSWIGAGVDRYVAEAQRARAARIEDVHIPGVTEERQAEQGRCRFVREDRIGPNERVCVDAQEITVPLRQRVPLRANGVDRGADTQERAVRGGVGARGGRVGSSQKGGR